MAQNGVPIPESTGEAVHKIVCALWQNKQQPTLVEQPTPVYVDFARWKIVEKYEKEKQLLLVDTKSIEKCSYIVGNSCTLNSYGQSVGYKFWLIFSHSNGLQISQPSQNVIDCDKRQFNGQDIVPQGPVEPVFNAMYSQS